MSEPTGILAFEYRVLDEWQDGGDVDEETLNELGLDGWELVSITPSFGSRSPSQSRFIFKRPL